MHPKPRSANGVEAGPYNNSTSAICSGPWLHSTGYNSISSSVVRGNPSESSSVEQSLDGQSQSDGGLNEEDDDTSKESQITAPPLSDGNYGQEHQKFQYPGIPPRNNTSIPQPPHLELVGHSIVYPQLYDIHHVRMPLPLEMEQEPVFVNPKQYKGILRRRQSRAKAELEKKLIKDRKPYLHESRHQHAMRRARSSGGRFAKKSEGDSSKPATAAQGSDHGSVVSSESANLSCSEPLRSVSAYTSKRHHEAKVPELVEDHKTDVHASAGSKYENQSGFHVPTYTMKDGGSAGQQWDSIASNKASHRALPMQ